MLFDSPAYFLFLALMVAIYWRLGWRQQNLFLLAGSYFFYGWWDWRFLGLMLLSTALDYVIAQRIADSDEPGRRKALLILSLVLNFTFLGFFKYFNFFTDSLIQAAASVGYDHLSLPVLRVILPPGISFYTFQEVAYIVDVYQRKQEPARSFVDYGLFVSLFPHLIAGPIQRPGHLLGQVQRPRHFDTTPFYDGLMLIAFGLFRKCVIADNFASLANAAFDGALGHNVAATAIGAIAFGFQIYGDFSGYSDLARGSAQLLGFHFVVNFRRPYLAVTLQDFWRRWHISLGTWLRDYLYFPLGGNRKGHFRTSLNLMITMLLGGLWHGASWTFVVWGGLHGGWLAFERFTSVQLRMPIEEKMGRWASRIFTLTVVGVAWIFFRANSVAQGAAMVRDLGVWQWQARYLPVFGYMAALGGLVMTIDWMLEQQDEEVPFQQVPIYSAAAAFAMSIAVVFFGGMESSAFIYFQF